MKIENCVQIAVIFLLIFKHNNFMEKGTVTISLEEYFSLIEFKKAITEDKCISFYDSVWQKNITFYNPSESLLEIKHINEQLSKELDFYKREVYENAKEISLLKKENQDLRLIKKKKNWFQRLFG